MDDKVVKDSTGLFGDKSTADVEHMPERDNAYHVVKDLCSGDSSVADIPEFLALNMVEIKKALAKIAGDPSLSKQEKIMLLSNSWMILYRVKPPTIEEFLSPDWIGATADSLYPHIKKLLCDFYAPGSKYRHLVLGAGIRVGKSTASVLASLFSVVNLWCMRNAKRFYGVAQSGSLTYGLISFTQDKALQVLLQPFLNILTSAPRFKRVTMEERLGITQENNPELVCWTTASKVGSLQFYGDLHYTVMSDPANLLGLNLVEAILSEISFFVDKGFGPDYIWRIFQDSKNRVYGTFQFKRYTGTILDSSPNDIQTSPIDRYIFSGEARKDPTNLVFTGTFWDYLPQRCPVWNADHSKTFPVFRGSTEKPPKVLQPEEVANYPSTEIYNVPIDLYKLFRENCAKNVKDYCGWPSGQGGMLLEDASDIENIFVGGLRNVYTYITAPAGRDPRHLIFDTIKTQFFRERPEGYEFWHNPTEKRYIHVDQSESGDVASIGMVHPEFDIEQNRIMPVVDFTIPICPEHDRVNLDAIRYFIQDLRDIGRINLGKVTFDQYQSSATIQFLMRLGIPCSRLSVDTDEAPYLLLVSYIREGMLKMGRNILFKNNLKSLHEVKSPHSGHTKIDHTDGKVIYDDGGDWETSSMGLYAKDVSDSVCGAVWSCLHEYKGVPKMQWIAGDMVSPEAVSQAAGERALEIMRNKYGFDTDKIKDTIRRAENGEDVRPKYRIRIPFGT